MPFDVRYTGERSELNVVVASQGVDVEVFSRADVQRHRHEVDAAETNPRTVRLAPELVSRNLRAIDLYDIAIEPTFHEVVSVTVVPDEQIEAGFTEHDVVPTPTDQGVVAGPAAQGVRSVASDQQIVSLTSVQVQGDEARQTDTPREGVVACLTIDIEVFRGADVQTEEGQVVALETHAAAVWVDREVIPCGIRAIHLNHIAIRTTLEQIASISVVPDEEIISLLSKNDVVATTSDQRIAARTAAQHVDPISTDQEVIAFASVEIQFDESGEPDGPRKDIITSLAIHIDFFSGSDVQSEQPQVVALETDALTVGGDTEIVTCTVRSIDLRRVLIGSPFEKIAAIAVVPDEEVTTGFAEEDVVSAAPDQRVVPGSATQCVDTVPTDQQVVSLAAVQVELGQTHQATRTSDDITPTLSIDVDVFRRSDVEGEQPQVVTLETNPLPVRIDTEIVSGPIGSIHLHDVQIPFTVHDVIAVPVVPDHEVTPGTTFHAIVTAIAQHRVVPRAPAQRIVATLATQEVVPRLSIEEIVLASTQ